jgi:hypothetical protein
MDPALGAMVPFMGNGQGQGKGGSNSTNIPLPPPPPREGDSAFVRRVRLIYMDRVMRHHQQGEVDDMKPMGKPVPQLVYKLASFLPYFAIGVFTCVGIIFIVMYAMKFDAWQEAHWFYASAIAFGVVTFLLETIRSAVITLVELRKFDIRRKDKRGDFVVRKIAKAEDGSLPAVLKPKAKKTSPVPPRAPPISQIEDGKKQMFSKAFPRIPMLKAAPPPPPINEEISNEMFKRMDDMGASGTGALGGSRTKGSKLMAKPPPPPPLRNTPQMRSPVGGTPVGGTPVGTPLVGTPREGPPPPQKQGRGGSLLPGAPLLPPAAPVYRGGSRSPSNVPPSPSGGSMGSAASFTLPKPPGPPGGPPPPLRGKGRSQKRNSNAVAPESGSP